MLEQDYNFYILKAPVDNASLQESELPLVIKVLKDKFGQDLALIDKNEGEGPFDSKFELRRKSTIFSSIRLQKHKERVLKNKNIKEIILKNSIFTPKGTTYEKVFVGALYHTMVGKISKKQVSGVHFYNPDSIRIVQTIESDNNGVYSAIIEKLHPDTGEWIRKNEVTNFFPDHWSNNQLFHECSLAYSNKEHISGNIYSSKTPSGIEVKFIINEDGKILTFYPVI